MELKTSTEFNSAEICRKLKEDPSITPSEIEDDLKRKVLGVGEIVTITLVDNSNEEKVKWSYEDPSQANFAVLETPMVGRKSIKLIVLKSLEEDVSVGIKVTNEFGDSREVTFELKIPHKFEGKHIPGNGGEGTVPTVIDKDGNEIPLQPGATGMIGAAGKLSVKVFPTEVSFRNVSIIERANDPPNFTPIHRPNPDSLRLNETNDFEDKVSAFSKGTGMLRGWTWNCSWKVVDDNGQDCLLITGKGIFQTVTFQAINHRGVTGVRTSISKFGCSVSRDSQTGEYNFGNTN